MSIVKERILEVISQYKYERNLPLNELADGMGDDLCAKTFTQENLCLEAVIYELKRLPAKRD